MKFYTGTLWANHPNKIDVTIKAGTSIFAPTWNIVTNLKNGLINEKEYKDMYYELIRARYKILKEEFNEYILSDKELCFTCFCPKDTFCHRFLLSDILVKLGAEYLGELT